MAQKLLIVEANEIAPRVFRKFAEVFPQSYIRRFFDHERFIETMASDIAEADLYPAQSWASFNTGLPYSEHKVNWYNDKKDFGDFYWHAAAGTGHSTIIVNTLHSSPMRAFASEGNYKVLIPDCFSAEPDTLPRDFESFQRLNLAVTQSNGRKAFLKQTLLQGVQSFAQDPRPRKWGLGMKSVADLTRITATARSRPERLRSAQFPLLASIFLDAMRAHLPELGVIFTNHVAAMQHRYWYATFPSEYKEPIYPQSWVERYKDEILSAMELLDRWLGRFFEFAVSNGYIMLVTTSMGQSANPNVSAEYVHKSQFDYRLQDPKRLLTSLIGELGDGAEIQGAMVPQYSFRFPSKALADAVAEKLKGFETTAESDISNPNTNIRGLILMVDQSDATITISVSILPNATDKIWIGGHVVNPEALGFVKLDVDDHHSGRHHAAGSLFVVNDRSELSACWKERIDYLEYAPAIKSYFGIKNKASLAKASHCQESA